MKTNNHFCSHLESNLHVTHKTLITVNYVLNISYRKKQKSCFTFSATYCIT